MATRSTTDYLQLLKYLLPIGNVWNTENDSNLHDYLYGAAEEFARIDQRFLDLLDERDTRYTDGLISNHEEDFGLPDECTDPASTLSERRDELHAKLLAVGGLHKQYYIDLAAAYGYTITITEFTPFWSGLGTCGIPCGDQWVIFVWQVTVNYTGGELIYFTSGGSVSGDPLIRAAGLSTLLCLISKYKPVHTIVKYVLDGYEYSSSFSNAFDAYPTTSVEWLYGAFDRSFSIAFDTHLGGSIDRGAFSNTQFEVPN